MKVAGVCLTLKLLLILGEFIRDEAPITGLLGAEFVLDIFN